MAQKQTKTKRAGCAVFLRISPEAMKYLRERAEAEKRSVGSQAAILLEELARTATDAPEK